MHCGAVWNSHVQCCCNPTVGSDYFLRHQRRSFSREKIIKLCGSPVDSTRLVFLWMNLFIQPESLDLQCWERPPHQTTFWLLCLIISCCLSCFGCCLWESVRCKHLSSLVCGVCDKNALALWEFPSMLVVNCSVGWFLLLSETDQMTAQRNY